MSASKILSAALSAFEQNFTMICRNRGIMLDKIDEKTFSELTALLMDAAQSAGVASTVCYMRLFE